MPGVGLLDRNRCANGGLGERGGSRTGVPVVVKGIVLERQSETLVQKKYCDCWLRTSSLASSVGHHDQRGIAASRRRGRTGCGRVCDRVSLEAERLFGCDSDGDTAAAIHCQKSGQSQVKVRSKSRASFVLCFALCLSLFVFVLSWRISRSHPSRCPYGS